MSTTSDQILMESKHADQRSSTTGLVSTGHTNAKAPSHGQSWTTVRGLALATVALAATVAYYQPWQTLAAPSAKAETEHAAAPRAVNIVRPAPATTANVVLPATLRPWQTAALHARANGYLAAWHRDLGSQVKAGDLLAEIETPELDQEVAESAALASEAAAAVVQAQAERVEAQAEIQVAESQLLRVQAEYELSKTQLVRREVLIQNRAISQEEHDTFRRQVEARAAEVAAAQSDVTRRRANLDTRSAIIQARQATANSRQASVDRLKELQGFKRIVAPFDGVITSRTAEVGMLVTAGKEALFVVEDLSRIRVQINVPQTYSMQAALGVPATVMLPESNVQPVQGEITRTAESVDAASRTMLAEIELDNAASRFQPGSYAQVTLAAAQSSTAWTIPTNTLSMRVDGPHVALVNDDNQIEIQPVKLGRDLGHRIVVAEGIRGGERLVVNPSDDLSTGVHVRIGEEPKSAQKVAQR